MLQPAASTDWLTVFATSAKPSCDCNQLPDTSCVVHLPPPCCVVACYASLPAGAVAKVLQAGLAAETLPLEKGLQYER